MTTSRQIYDEIQNTVDFLISAELVYYPNSISLSATRVSWHPGDPTIPFLMSRAHPTIEQYLAWLTSGAYTVVLFDGSLLQLTYDIADGRVVGHRLAYVPCPYDVDPELLRGGEPLADIIELYRSTDAVLRSPIRFDYDAMSRKPGHPTVHLTMNSVECRIACVAPLHVLRFVDFVFRNFYGSLWKAHETYFRETVHKHIGAGSLSQEERRDLHLTWEVNSAPAAVLVTRRRLSPRAAAG